MKMPGWQARVAACEAAQMRTFQQVFSQGIDNEISSGDAVVWEARKDPRIMWEIRLSSSHDFLPVYRQPIAFVSNPLRRFLLCWVPFVLGASKDCNGNVTPVAKAPFCLTPFGNMARTLSLRVVGGADNSRVQSLLRRTLFLTSANLAPPTADGSPNTKRRQLF
jgi:hypothetical protein